MPLLLRIDNLDSLPDGGPVTFELDRRGIDIGRDPYLDWTLPDPERFVSGKHAELRYRDGGYWLHDVSTNGTTINGRGGRLTEPYRLQDGDRVHIGQYIIAVELQGEDAAPPPPAAAGPRGNVWGDVPDAAAVVDRRDFAARVRAEAEPGGPRGPAELPEEDISWSIGELTEGTPEAGDPWDAPPAGRDSPAGDAWGWSPPAADAPDDLAPAERQSAPAAPTQPAGPDAAGSTGVRPRPETGPEPEQDAPRRLAANPGTVQPDTRDPSPSAPDPFAPDGDLDSPGQAAPTDARRAEPPPPPPPGEGPSEPSRIAPSGLASQWTGGAPQPATVPGEPGSAATARPKAGSGGGDFVAAFERGAGLPAGAVANRADEVFAEELGALFRLVTQHLQAMLLARAETKGAMRSADRTMINALENNPLKFSPGTEEAMRIMFGAKSRSYLDARATIDSSFGDLQRHQVQTFGAMQQALRALIDDLDPQSIEAATPEDGGLAGIVGSRRARLWDAYMERFRAKSARHERGMVDAFMLLFAEMYDRQR